MCYSTRDVGGDFGQDGLAEALGCAGSGGDQVGGPGVKVGEHVVGLVAQLGHRSPGTRHVDARVRRLDALVTDLRSHRKR